ncbi:hypothetical protein BDM02DRAFT_3118329 [Thelephora ganbajun]|uniref:Uncharacterized protein n=1 Tax=Thelephora ganbajun TaxID=370292 RepID=A0ACB6ZBB7_THEGA|nr:hypothetical protein BDM02DRAFT_3118329 [Thelephora ganbajun]
MSTTFSLPAHTTRYITPSYPLEATVSSSTSLPMTTPKPKIPKVNVFSNDGSFLERLHKLKRGEVEKKKHAEILQQKRDFGDRFKNRGKRPPPVATGPSPSSVTSSDEDGPRPSKRSRS